MRTSATAITFYTFLDFFCLLRHKQILPSGNIVIHPGKMSFSIAFVIQYFLLSHEKLILPLNHHVKSVFTCATFTILKFNFCHLTVAFAFSHQHVHFTFINGRTDIAITYRTSIMPLSKSFLNT